MNVFIHNVICIGANIDVTEVCNYCSNFCNLKLYKNNFKVEKTKNYTRKGGCTVRRFKCIKWLY